MLISLVLLSGCASASAPCRPMPVPALPEAVTKEAAGSSSISDEVQSWLESVLSSFDEKTRP
mgnify:CR=1 FL=1